MKKYKKQKAIVTTHDLGKHILHQGKCLHLFIMASDIKRQKEIK